MSTSTNWLKGTGNCEKMSCAIPAKRQALSRPASIEEPETDVPGPSTIHLHLVQEEYTQVQSTTTSTCSARSRPQTPLYFHCRSERENSSSCKNRRRLCLRRYHYETLSQRSWRDKEKNHGWYKGVLQKPLPQKLWLYFTHWPTRPVRHDDKFLVWKVVERNGDQHSICHRSSKCYHWRWRR